MPDRPRKARLAVTVTFFASGALFGTWAVRIPAVKHDLDLDEAQLGSALFAIAVGALVAMPASGWLVARIGSRGPTAVGLVLASASLVAPALADGLVTLALGLFAYGAAQGALDVAMNANGLGVERDYGRPILSSFHAAFSFGGLAGAGGGSLAAAVDLGPLSHFGIVAAAFAAVGLVTGRLLLPDGRSEAAAPKLTRPPRGLALLGLLTFCCLFAEGAAADWSAVYIDGPLDASATVAGLGFAAFSLTMTFGRIVGDRLTERWGAVSLTRTSGLLAAAGLGLALITGRPEAAIVGFACLGAGLSTVIPAAFRAAGSSDGIPTGVGIASVATVGYFGFLVGPPAIGWAAKLVGLPTALGLVVVLSATIALLASSTATGRGVRHAAAAAPLETAR